MLYKLGFNAKILDKFIKGITLVGLFSFLNACAGKPPLKDYVLAREAKNFAQKHNANKHANALFYKGGQAYKKAMYFYDRREHDKALEYFTLARRYFEKAEVKARLKMLDGGGEDFL